MPEPEQAGEEMTVVRGPSTVTSGDGDAKLVPGVAVDDGGPGVERINAERTIPLGALTNYVRRRVGSDLTVTALDVADEIDVTEDQARLALTLSGPDVDRNGQLGS